MRVISGSARGLRLRAPDGLKTRPTTDRIKESLFNIISADIGGSRFLDLFSGSGAIGIEALSRGAQYAVFVDMGRESISIIRRNAEAARLTDRTEIIRADAAAAIKRLSARGDTFDIIFMDPPYGKGLVQNAVNGIAAEGILSRDGFIIAEMSEEDEPPITDGIEVYRIKDYKTTKMVFMRRTVTSEVQNEHSSISGQL